MEKRVVHTRIWRDSWFMSLSRTSKLVFLYLITNQAIGFSGYFECPDRVICFEADVSLKELQLAKSELVGKVTFAQGWVKVINSEKLDPIRGENNPLWKAYNKEMEKLSTSIKNELDAIDQSQKDPTKGLRRGYEAPHGNGNGNGIKKGGVGENKHATFESLTKEVVSELADSLGVSPSDVEKQRVYMGNYLLSSGKTYKNYLAALRNWVQRKIDEGKIKRTRIVGGSTASDLLAQKERQYAVNS